MLEFTRYEIIFPKTSSYYKGNLSFDSNHFLKESKEKYDDGHHGRGHTQVVTSRIMREKEVAATAEAKEEDGRKRLLIVRYAGVG